MSSTAEIEKRSIIGYNTTTVNFGTDESKTYQIPLLDVTQKVSLTFGKYEVTLPEVTNNLTGETLFNTQTVTVTVPAKVETQNLTPDFTPQISEINIQNPGLPTKPQLEDFETVEEYEEAMEQYAKDLEAYYNAVATYKAAQKAQELIQTGEQKSLEIEQIAVNAVNKIMNAYLVNGISKLKTVFQSKMEELNDKKEYYEDLVTNLQQQLEEAQATGDETQVQILEEKISAYTEAVEEITEATAGLGEEAIEFSQEMVEGFKKDMESLIEEFTREAEKNRELAESRLARAEELAASGTYNADYYIALGEGILYDAIASGFEQGAEIATAVLESYVDVDVTANPDVAASLDSVDVSNVDINI